ncbi:MAG: protein kinase [Desulfomonile tiedjei]|nr:protein kinase [Desulfomonile tiedjei]
MTDPKTKGLSSPMARQAIFEPRMFGRYCLIDQISQGGMCGIFLAKTMSVGGFQKPLIIKKLLPEYSTRPRYVKRFVNEARTLARLSHSNIAQIIDMGVINGEYYIALEYIEGRNVAHVLSKAAKTGRYPSLEFVLHVALEVAKGLAYAHRKKAPSGESLMLVHQDVNSFNVMVSYEAEVKIIDFGIARIFLGKAQDGLPVAGKLLYFSPEQLQKKPVDRRVDIYGTGVLLYEMLAGKRLIQHQATVGQTVKTILEMDVAEKVNNNAKIRPELKPILIKAMALNPDDRYSWMEEMIEDLRPAVKKCALDLDPVPLSAYMKEEFRREILLDRHRMRRLLDDERPRLLLAGKSGKPPKEGQSEEGVVPEARRLTGNSWPFNREPRPQWEGDTPGIKSVCFRAGQIIYRTTDSASEVYVIRSGKIRLFFKAGKVRQTLCVLGEGDFFGETALLNDRYRSSWALAEENCEVVCLERQVFESFLGEGLPGEITCSLIEKLRDTTALLEGNIFTDNLARLIHALVFFQRRNSQRNGRDIDLNELKDLFHLEDERQVQKYLGKLEDLNILKAQETSVQIQNPEKLENILSILSGRGRLTLKL